MTRHSKTLLVACVVSLAVIVAGCGSSSSKSGSSGGSDGSVGAQQGAAKSSAQVAGEKDAGTSTGTLPKVKLGFLQITNDSEVSRRIENGAKAATAALGWQFVDCDAEGDPAKEAACGETLLNEGAQVVLSNSIAAPQINTALTQAAAKHIPWFSVGGEIPQSSKFTAQFAPSDEAMAQTLDNWLIPELKQRYGTKSISVATIGFPALLALGIRQKALTAALKTLPNAKIVASHTSDFTNLSGDTITAANAILTSHPDISLIWNAQDATVPGVVSVLRQKGLTGSKRPIVTGWFGDLIELQEIRDGQLDATVEVPNEASSWQAVDEAAQILGMKSAANRNPTYSIDFTKPILVTKANVPASGYVKPSADFVTYFEAKWDKQFGLHDIKAGS